MKIYFKYMNDIKNNKENKMKKKNKNCIKSIENNNLASNDLAFININNKFHITRKSYVKNKKHSFLFSILLNILLSSLLFYLSNEINSITIKIKGTGTTQILNKTFIPNLYSVMINGNTANKNNHTYYLIKSDNVIIMNFYSISSCEYMFESIKMEEVEIYIESSIEKINYMFRECSKLKKVTVNSFNLMNGFEAQYLFSKCSNLQEIELSRISIKYAKKIEGMFFGCSSLSYYP